MVHSGKDLLVWPEKLTEIDNIGSEIATYPLLGIPYVVTSDSDDLNQQFSFASNFSGQVHLHPPPSHTTNTT